ncbi:hypothetical protein IWW50_000989, partial [Coemansia erecta]
MEEKLEAVPSIPVPSMPAAPSAVQNVSLVAEDAASAMYKARDAMAGVFVGDDERAEFSELVKSASEGVENLEKFPTILDDSQQAVKPKASSVEQVIEDKIEEAKPVASEVAEKTEVVKPVVAKVAEKAKEAKPVVTEVVDKAKEAASAAESLVESAVAGAPESAASPESSSESSSELPPADNIVVSIEPTQDETAGAGSDSSVNEDVRKSASNLVKDMRKSISMELAEERTRTGAADAGTTLSDVGG